jgi:hypothetical protein
MILWGEYLDQWVEVDGRWLIKERPRAGGGRSNRAGMAACRTPAGEGMKLGLVHTRRSSCAATRNEGVQRERMGSRHASSVSKMQSTRASAHITKEAAIERIGHRPSAGAACWPRASHRRVLYTYAATVPTGSTLDADAIVLLARRHRRPRSYTGGVDGFIEFVGPALERFDPRTNHVLGNMLIDVDLPNDVARAETYPSPSTASTTPTAAEQDMVAGLRYVDRFERRGGEWRIATRVCAFDWRRTDPTGDGSTFTETYTRGLRGATTTSCAHHGMRSRPATSQP